MNQEDAQKIVALLLGAESQASIARPSPKVFLIDKPLRSNAVIETPRGPLTPTTSNSRIMMPFNIGDNAAPPGDNEAPPGDSIVSSDTTPEWAYFVDDYPQANFEHPCRYLIVRADSSVQEIAESLPPSSRTNAPLVEINLFSK